MLHLQKFNYKAMKVLSEQLLQEKARLQAQSVEATKTLYQKEKTAAEEAYQREMGRTADALSQLKRAERDKVFCTLASLSSN